jgi:hypothetical protein
VTFSLKNHGEILTTKNTWLGSAHLLPDKQYSRAFLLLPLLTQPTKVGAAQPNAGA